MKGKKISISGIKRSGSTCMYNVVRLILQEMGYNITACGNSYRHRQPDENEVMLNKIHTFSDRIADEADFIFLTDRNIDEIKNSFYRFKGRWLSHEELLYMREDLRNWTLRDNAHIIDYRRFKDNMLTLIRFCKRILDADVDEHEILRQFNRIELPNEGKDENTLLFSNHITSKTKSVGSKRFLILGCARTGSTFLQRLLDDHPDICCKGEVFKYNLEYEKAFYSLCEYTGMKLHYYHNIEWDKLGRDDEIKIIHLERKDEIRRYISLKIAQKTQNWQSTDGSSNTTIEFDIEEFKWKVNYLNDLRDKALKYVDKNDILNISYEQLVSDKENALKKIQKFICVDCKTLSTHLMRQNPEHIKELISNYDEVSQFISSYYDE